MNAAIITIAAIALLLAAPTIARELRRIIVTVWSEIAAMKAEIAAIHALPAPEAPAVDLSGIQSAIEGINSRIDAIAAQLGEQPAEQPAA